MSRFRFKLATTTLALALAACAQKPLDPPFKGSADDIHLDAQAAPPPVATPKYQKPVRMNGRGKVSSISLEQVFALQQSGKALIFDARPGFIYGLGHIPGAINLPISNCDERIHPREAAIKAALAEGKALVVYCTGPLCPDARSVAMHLSGFGFPASVFSGGWQAWKEAEMPVE